MVGKGGIVNESTDCCKSLIPLDKRRMPQRQQL